MAKTAVKKAAGSARAKPKAAVKPAAAKPAKSKAVAAASKAAMPKAKIHPEPKPAPPAPVATDIAAPVTKSPAAALNGHGGKAGKASPKFKAPPAPKEKSKKSKLVRDSFTMPELEYQALGEVKKACLKAGFEVKKSELLRVGVALVKQLDPAKLKAALSALPTLKAGRPKKEK